MPNFPHSPCSAFVLPYLLLLNPHSSISLPQPPQSAYFDALYGVLITQLWTGASATFDLVDCEDRVQGVLEGVQIVKGRGRSWRNGVFKLTKMKDDKDWWLQECRLLSGFRIFKVKIFFFFSSFLQEHRGLPLSNRSSSPPLSPSPPSSSSFFCSFLMLHKFLPSGVKCGWLTEFRTYLFSFILLCFVQGIRVVAKWCQVIPMSVNSCCILLGPRWIWSVSQQQTILKRVLAVLWLDRCIQLEGCVIEILPVRGILQLAWGS